MKMKLKAKAQQLRIYTKRSTHYQQNKLFNEDAKGFYHQINNQKPNFKNQQIEHFWCRITEVAVTMIKQLVSNRRP